MSTTDTKTKDLIVNKMTLTQYTNNKGTTDFSNEVVDIVDIDEQINAKANSADLATVATTGSYNDLQDKPAISTINDATLTIQKNGTTVTTFTANSATDTTANITVPTTTNDLTNDSGFITNDVSNLTNYRTSSAQDIIDSGKADKTATGNKLDYTGTTLSLQTNTGTNLSQVTIKSTPDLDNSTISLNSSDELQAIGVIEKNAGAVKYDWIGTLAEYNEQNVKVNHPDWICWITDDVSGGDSVYTKDETDDLLDEKLNNSQITNCITKIPQDIKLELNDGTLTLKAGSKVYVPNGFEEDGTTPKFDEVVIESDLTTITNGASQMFLHINIYGSLFAGYMTGGTVSEMPSSPIRYASYYNTSANTCEFYNGSYWNKISLPIAIVTRTGSSGFSSIDQVFNGFGYIGSTIFALPGVEGLIPNGRNADGSLKNVKFTTSRVLTYSFYNNSGKKVINIYDGSLGVDIGSYPDSNFFIQDNAPVNYTGTYALWFDTESNILKYTENTGATWNKVNIYNAVYINLDADSKITSFNPKQPVNLVDRSDSSWLSGLSMPSSRYIDLTLLPDTSIYTAPANGWVNFLITGLVSYQYLAIENMSNGIRTALDVSSGVSSGDTWGVFLPVQKGQLFKVWYGGTPTVVRFRFIYAEGEN